MRLRSTKMTVQAHRHPPFDLFENGNMLGTRQDFFLAGEIPADTKQL
jgi:hypothetical protein